jgi:hypothetical protein
MRGKRKKNTILMLHALKKEECAKKLYGFNRACEITDIDVKLLQTPIEFKI